MSPSLWWVLALLAATVTMFAVGKPRMDVAALLMLVILPLSGAVTLTEAFAGFSDPNVILIAALFVVGAGLSRSGLTHRLGDWMAASSGGSSIRLVVMLMICVATLGSVMSSTGVVAIFVPVALAVAARLKTSPRTLLMPLSYAGLISGMLTLIGTTSNLMVNAELIRHGSDGLSFFSLTPIGVVILALGVGYMLVTRRWLGDGAPGGESASLRSMRDLLDAYKVTDRGRSPEGPELVVEVLLPSGSAGVGRRVSDLDLVDHGVQVMGLRHHGRAVTTPVERARVQAGDSLLVAGEVDAITQLGNRASDFVVLDAPASAGTTTPAGDRSALALLSLLVMVGLMISGIVPNVLAALIACLLLGVFGIIDMPSAYRAIDWPILLVIIGMLPFAQALKNTGGTELAARGLISMVGDAGPSVVVAAVFAITALFGLFISNTATAVLMAPVAIAMADQLGASPYPLALAVALAASTSFMTPVSSPVNALIVEPGRYTFMDFVRIGTPFTFVVLVVSAVMIPLLYPF